MKCYNRLSTHISDDFCEHLRTALLIPPNTGEFDKVTGSISCNTMLEREISAANNSRVPLKKIQGLRSATRVFRIKKNHAEKPVRVILGSVWIYGIVS